jgi:two-component system chemotaxis sensor kinase CheA
MSDYLDPNNEELLKDFFSEAQQQVDTLEQNVLSLENNGADKDTIDEIFRAAHTLKGGSATVEFMELSHFAHTVEDVFDAIRSNKLQVSEDVIDTILSGVDVIKAMLEKRMSGEIYQEDTKEIEGKLEALIPPDDKKKAKAAPPALPANLRPATEQLKAAAPAPAASQAAVKLTAEELGEFKQLAAGQPVYKITVKFDENGLMNTVGGIQVYTSVKGIGTVLKTEPDFDSLYGDTFYPTVDYYVACGESVDGIRKYVVIPDISLDATIDKIDLDAPPQEAGAAAASPAPAPAAVVPASAPVAAAPAAAAEASPAPKPAAAPAPAAKAAPAKATNAKAAAEAAKAGKEASSILRVDSKRIDDLLNLVSETVITKATFNQISMQFSDLQSQLHNIEGTYRDRVKALMDEIPGLVQNLQQGGSVKDARAKLNEEYGDISTLFDGYGLNLKSNFDKFRSTSQNLGRITSELQEGVMRIRMVPISQIFSRFPRLVRDLCKQLNKKVNLVIEGEDTELDKSVVDDLLDPIMHSVRNSVDHGIEDADTRKKAGKPEEGMVLLKASNEGNMIMIEIGDDGAGIDVSAVKAKAVQRGIISASKVLTDVEAFQLIFEPGFSTSKTITNISGRGVGLDVVKRSVEKLNGSVTVHSEWGKGTTFTIKLPLTLAIIQGLLVRVGPEVYSIPITSVIESVRIKPSEVQKIDNYEVFTIRNEVISLIRLNQLFGIKTEENKDYNFIVIVGTAESKMGFMVDSLIGEEDVVIKPLRDQYTNSPGIAGASILGDGSVSLIIDVGQLLELGLHREQQERKARESLTLGARRGLAA